MNLRIYDWLKFLAAKSSSRSLVAGLSVGLSVHLNGKVYLPTHLPTLVKVVTVVPLATVVTLVTVETVETVVIVVTVVTNKIFHQKHFFQQQKTLHPKKCLPFFLLLQQFVAEKKIIL